jgi:hypothetical protein
VTAAPTGAARAWSAWSGAPASPPLNTWRATVSRPFERALGGLAVAVFGDEATVVPHLRANGKRQQLVFVVDAADPSANVDYAAFLPREQTFWTAYAHVPKPDVPFTVAIRPARGWCRSEALAPLFAFLPAVEDAS